MKKKLVILSAAALTAATAVPALALENEFHGMFRVKALLTNFQSAGLSGIQTANTSTGKTTLLSNENRNYTLFEQRARLQYIAKANDDLKLVTHFEIDSTWGDAAFQNNRGQGAGLGADTVNLETKNVYLDFKIPATPLTAKVGLQGFTDAYKGIFLNDDVAGAAASGRFDAVTATGAFFRTYDAGGTTALGDANVDVYVLDGRFGLNKTTSLGASYYLASNDVNYSGQQTHTLGINAATKLGTVDLDAFLLYQTGDELYGATGKDLSALAGQVAAKANIGLFTLRGAGLYASGDDNSRPDKSYAYQNLLDSGAAAAAPGTGNSSGQYYSANMLILLRNSFNMDSDNSLAPSINNGNRGLVGVFLGADARISDKFSASVNIGNVAVDKRDQKVTAKSATTNSNIGAEANVNLNYLLYTNLTATVQGAYAQLGGYTRAGNAKDLQNPYLTALMLNYIF